jgi:hypothetical protein
MESCRIVCPGTLPSPHFSIQIYPFTFGKSSYLFCVFLEEVHVIKPCDHTGHRSEYKTQITDGKSPFPLVTNIGSESHHMISEGPIKVHL